VTLLKSSEVRAQLRFKGGALRIASLVTPHSAHRPAKRPRHVRLLGKARVG
jgi:hypothetical protein